MINIRKKGGLLSMRLSRESTIASVEADALVLKEKIESIGGVRRIEVDGAPVEEMDTSYLQLLVSLDLTAQVKGIEFLISRPSERFRELAGLYGLNMEDLNGRKTWPEPL